MIWFKMLCIAVAVTLIIDETDFLTSVKKGIWRIARKTPYREFRLKPFDCSLCMTHWILLLYVCLQGFLDVYSYTFIIIISCLTPVIKNLFEMLRDMMYWLINRVWDYFS